MAHRFAVHLTGILYSTLFERCKVPLNIKIPIFLNTGPYPFLSFTHCVIWYTYCVTQSIVAKFKNLAGARYPKKIQHVTI